MSHEIDIKTKRCDCNSENAKKREACRYTVLESSSSKFPVRRFSVQAENPTLWNLALFGLPEHPQFDRLGEVKNVSWLSIETNPEGKAQAPYAGGELISFLGRSQLQEALEIAFKIRDKQQRDYDAAKIFARYAAEHPTTNLRSPSFRSPSMAQSEFSHGLPRPKSLYGTA